MSFVLIYPEEVEHVERVLEDRGIIYRSPRSRLPEEPGTIVLGGTYVICTNIYDNADLRSILVDGKRMIDVYTWRPLFFPRWPPWEDYMKTIEMPWGVARSDKVFSISTALLIIFAFWLMGLYASWKLGMMRGVIPFIVPYLLQAYQNLRTILFFLLLPFFIEQIPAQIPMPRIHVPTLIVMSVALALLLLYPLAFYLGWRRGRRPREPMATPLQASRGLPPAPTLEMASIFRGENWGAGVTGVFRTEIGARGSLGSHGVTNYGLLCEVRYEGVWWSGTKAVPPPAYVWRSVSLDDACVAAGGFDVYVVGYFQASMALRRGDTVPGCAGYNYPSASPFSCQDLKISL